MNERKWKHNALHTMNVRLVRRNKMKLLKRLKVKSGRLFSVERINSDCSDSS